MPEGKQITRNHVWGREKRRVKEGAAAIFLMQRGGLKEALHSWKIRLNYNHTLPIQIINKMI